MIDRPVILLGGGGHARVLLEALRGLEARIEGCVSPARPERSELQWLGDDPWLMQQDRSRVLLVNALGSTKSTAARAALFDRFRAEGFAFATIVHRTAIVASNVEFGIGVQVMAGAIVQSGARLRDNVLVNTGAQLDHDCEVGAHAHVAPGVVFSGDVRVAQRAHIGTAATVIQGVRIGEGAVVGAGAVVLRDVAAGAVVVGNPAREVHK